MLPEPDAPAFLCGSGDMFLGRMRLRSELHGDEISVCGSMREGEKYYGYYPCGSVPSGVTGTPVGSGIIAEIGRSDKT